MSILCHSMPNQHTKSQFSTKRLQTSVVVSELVHSVDVSKNAKLWLFTVYICIFRRFSCCCVSEKEFTGLSMSVRLSFSYCVSNFYDRGHSCATIGLEAPLLEHKSL
jgi:hypothetical protein